MTAPKYDKSNLIKSAWNMFKAGKKYRNHVLTFAECLKEAWKAEKTRFAKAMGIVYPLEQSRRRTAQTRCRQEHRHMLYVIYGWYIGRLLCEQQI